MAPQTPKQDHWPQVGVAVIIVRDGEVLLGKRKGSHGEGTWAFPGGKLDAWESVEDCAKRETAEETGMKMATARILPVFTEDLFYGKHFITLYVLTEAEGDPVIREPEKCEEWGWFSWDDKPRPLFLTLQNLDKQGYRPPGM